MVKQANKNELSSSFKSNESNLSVPRQSCSNPNLGKMSSKSIIKEEKQDKGNKYGNQDMKVTVDSELEREDDESEDEQLLSVADSNIAPMDIAVREDPPQISIIEDENITVNRKNFTSDKRKTIKLLKKKNSNKKENSGHKVKQAEASSMLRIESTDIWTKNYGGKGKSSQDKKVKTSRSKY